MDPQLLQAALGRPQTVAETSQASMLEPLNRYKSALGRATTPPMQEALRRQTSPQNGAPEGQQYLPGAPLAEAGAAMSRYGTWKNPMTPYVDQWQKFREGAPDYTDEWKKYQNLPPRFFELAGESNPGQLLYQRIMRGPTAT
jgi:hypothetical protein